MAKAILDDTDPDYPRECSNLKHKTSQCGHGSLYRNMWPNCHRTLHYRYRQALSMAVGRLRGRYSGDLWWNWRLPQILDVLAQITQISARIIKVGFVIPPNLQFCSVNGGFRNLIRHFSSTQLKG